MTIATATYLNQVSAVSWESPDGRHKVRRITAGTGGAAYEVTPEKGRPALVSSLAAALEAVTVLEQESKR